MVIAEIVNTGNALDGVVVAGVVAVRAFVAVLVEADMALQHDLGRGRHLERDGDAVDQLDPLAAQQAGELVLGHGVRHRRDGGQGDAGVGAEHGGGGQGIAAASAPSADGAARRRDA